MPIHICTIAARNYLAFVRTLATSFAEVHPDGRVSALIFDDLDGEVGDSEPFDVIRLSDLGADMGELHRMAMIYRVTELATALKPWLLESLVEPGAPVLYLDPDIRVFSSLQALSDMASERGIVLTPHADTPFPDDGKSYDEDVILAAGIYNLGFIGIGDAARPFLGYWREKLRRQCIVRPELMRFVDQRWVDPVPGMYDHAIVRDPSYNVAYWNLHGRTVTVSDGGYEVNGRPLAFFHFSGFTPTKPYLLSKFQGERPRVLLSEHPPLAKLCAEYADTVMANGAAEQAKVEYGFARMADGTPIDDLMRAVYRKWLDEAESSDPAAAVPLPPDPFERRGAAQVIEGLNTPPREFGDPGRLTLYLASLYPEHKEIHERFPDPQRSEADHAGFMAWVADEVTAGRIPASLAREPDGRPLPWSRGGAPGVVQAGEDWAPPDRLRPGVVVAGYLHAELGIGEGARLLVKAVEASGVPYRTVAYRATSSRQEFPFSPVGADVHDYDTNVVAVNADMTRRFANEAGRPFFDGRYTIGQWAWELEEFPEAFEPALDVVDEVWACSNFMREAVAQVTSKPVFTFNYPVVEPVVPSGVARSDLGLPDGHMFLFCFDTFSVVQRKNPMGVLDAFCEAFQPGEGPILVLKMINAKMATGSANVYELERLRWKASARPDVFLIDRYLDHDANAALMAMCDCYVSLHRSEGFGLTMAEAMALGKPVIATAYSGNLDFMDDATAYLVPYTLTRVPAGCEPYREGARWADPDVREAAHLMKLVAGDPGSASATGRRAKASVLEHHGVAQGAAFVSRRFQDIHAARTSPNVTGVAPRGWVGGMRRQGVRVARKLYRAAEPLMTSVSGGHHEQVARLVAAVGDLERRLDAGPVSLDVAKASAAALRVVPDMGDPPPFTTRQLFGQEVLGYRASEHPVSGYAAFEDIFRGPEHVIRDRLRWYLPLVSELSPVVDVGCGRGEMLDLLAEAGVQAEGIDADESMVARTRAKGHVVTHADAIEELRRRPDGSIGALVSFQVIEHLPFETLMELLREARRVVRPGGVFIAETVNPHALQAFKCFWVDLTHRSPIFPEVLLTHCRDAGFAEACVAFQGGTGVVSQDRWTCGDYAVIASVQA